jgi:anti-anti-sigma regulatory factor
MATIAQRFRSTGGMPDARLAITLSSSGPTCALRLCGILDRYSVIALESLFDQLSSGQFDRITIDVCGLQGLDAVGINVLKRLGTVATEDGVTLFLRDRQPLVPRDTQPDPGATLRLLDDDGPIGGREIPGP